MKITVTIGPHALEEDWGLPPEQWHDCRICGFTQDHEIHCADGPDCLYGEQCRRHSEPRATDGEKGE